MKARILLLSTALVALPAMAQAVTNQPSPQPSTIHPSPVVLPVWLIKVLGSKGESLGAFTLELSDESTDTCMSGNWKKARVVQSSFQSVPDQIDAPRYFPTYEISGQNLTIQLNSPRLCDAYLMLSGKFRERVGSGEYFGDSLGGKNHLGTFTAERQKH